MRLRSLVLAVALVLSAGGCERTAAPSATPERASSASDLLPSDRAINDEPVRDLFLVETSDPDYWRITSIDRFDGTAWSSSDPDGSDGGVRLSTPATLPSEPASTSPRGGRPVTRAFRSLADFDGETAIPISPDAERIDGSFGTVTWEAHHAQAFIDGTLVRGTEYTVRSRSVAPTPEELDRVEFLTPDVHGRWTALPSDLDPRFARIAGRWTRGAVSDYRKILAIQERFQRPDFVYSTDVTIGVDSEALLDFLTRTKTGFCSHYTGAMVVMLRAIGIPARIAVGFRAGAEQPDGTYLVRTDDAHVWVEVLFPGYGWLPFEPEHGTDHPNAVPGTYLDP